MAASENPVIRWCLRHAQWPLVAAAAALVAFHVVRAFDPARDEVEGSMLLVANRGLVPHADWLRGPIYTVTPYPPLYFAIARVAGALLPSAVPLAPGRLVSIAAGVATAAMIAWVVARRSGVASAGASAAVLFLGYPGIAFWLHDFRVDALAAMLAIAAYVACGIESGGLVASAVLVVIGSTAKQTVALAAVPIVIHLWVTGRRRAALLYAAGVAALGAGVWLTLVVVSDGYYWWLGIVGNRRQLFPRQAALLVLEFMRNPVTIAAWATLAVAWVRDRAGVARSPFATFFVCSSAIAFCLSAGEGATNNYLIEPAALAAILVGLLGVAPLWRAAPKQASVLLALAGTAGCIVMIGATMRATRHQASPPDYTTFRQSLPTPDVLVDPWFIGTAIRSGLQPVVNDPYFLAVGIRNKVIDPTLLEHDVREGRVSGLILTSRLNEPGGTRWWPANVAPLLRADFTYWGQAGGSYLYRRSPRD